MPEKWTINRLADETGFDRRTIAKWLRDTKPFESDNKSDYYTLRDFIEARDASASSKSSGNTGDLETEQTRLTAAKADIAEVDRARIRNEVIEVETVFNAWENILVSVRRTILTSALLAKEQDAILNDLKSIKLEDLLEQREFDQGTAAENP